MITITTPHINVKTGGLLKSKADDARALFGTGFRTSTHVGYYVENVFLTVTEAIQIVQIPDTMIDGMELFIRVDSVDDIVPIGLFGATITDEAGEITNLTWAEWCMENKSPVDIDGELFVRASSNTNNWPELSTLEPVYSSLIEQSNLPKHKPTDP